MNQLWKKYLFLSFISAILLFALSLLWTEPNASDQYRSGVFSRPGHHNSSNSINSTQASQFPDLKMNTSIIQGSTMTRVDNNPILLNKLTVVSETRARHSNSKTNLFSHHSRLSVSGTAASVKTSSISDTRYAVNNRNVGRSNRFEPIQKTALNQVIALRTTKVSPVVKNSDFWSSDMGSVKQSLNILPGTGGNASSEDAVPLDDEYLVLLLMLFIYFAIRLLKRKRAVLRLIIKSQLQKFTRPKKTTT